MRIAVCDDCRQDACTLRDMLPGQEVKLYGNAESLLADVEQGGKHFDLYLLDIFMENSMNGIELAGKLRAGDERPPSALSLQAMIFTGRRTTCTPFSIS